MSEHVPVLLKEVIEGLNIRKDGIYLDCTLGRAGHSQEILKRLDKGLLIGPSGKKRGFISRIIGK